MRLKIRPRGTKPSTPPLCDCGFQKILSNEKYQCPNCVEHLRNLAERFIKNESGIPTDCHAGLSAIRTTPHNQKFLAYCHSVFKDLSLLQKGSWFLYGPTGAGKTFHAGCFGAELMRRHLIKVRFLQIGEYLDTIKATLGEKKRLQYELNDIDLDLDPRWDQVNGALRQVEDKLAGLYSIQEQRTILILDDFVRKFHDGFEQQRLYDIIEYHSRNHLFTVFTAQDKHLRNLPEQTASRISDMAFPFHIGDHNWRKRYDD